MEVCSKQLQWNLHKMDTIGEQPSGRLERWSSLGGFDCQLRMLLQMNLGALLTASLVHIYKLKRL